MDGASIPRFFWRFIGSPFIGRYRRASVIHDVHCNLKCHSSAQVHRVFYEMMLKAWAMWLAVRLFGPRFKGRLNRDA